jgi:hypothetical protein
MMEVPGRDVTADPLEPERETLPPDAPRREETRPDGEPRKQGEEDDDEDEVPAQVRDRSVEPLPAAVTASGG